MRSGFPVLAGMALLVSTAYAQFVNGDFETGDMTGWSTVGDVYLLTDPDTGNDYARVQDNSITGSAMLSQTFSTGMSPALVRFDRLAARLLPGGYVSVKFFSAANSLLAAFEMSNNTAEAFTVGFQSYEFNLGVSGGPFRVEAFADPATDTYIDVDNFAVVPEPGAIAGLAGGLAALGSTLRRRRR